MDRYWLTKEVKKRKRQITGWVGYNGCDRCAYKKNNQTQKTTKKYLFPKR